MCTCMCVAYRAWRMWSIAFGAEHEKEPQGPKEIKGKALGKLIQQKKKKNSPDMAGFAKDKCSSPCVIYKMPTSCLTLRTARHLSSCVMAPTLDAAWLLTGCTAESLVWTLLLMNHYMIRSGRLDHTCWLRTLVAECYLIFYRLCSQTVWRKNTLNGAGQKRFHGITTCTRTEDH